MLQVPYAAPGMQAPLPQYAAVGYGQYPYMNMPGYGVNNAYFPQPPSAYGAYPSQVALTSQCITYIIVLLGHFFRSSF
jgi:hypothetical protein